MRIFAFPLPLHVASPTCIQLARLWLSLSVAMPLHGTLGSDRGWCCVNCASRTKTRVTARNCRDCEVQCAESSAAEIVAEGGIWGVDDWDHSIVHTSEKRKRKQAHEVRVRQVAYVRPQSRLLLIWLLQLQPNKDSQTLSNLRPRKRRTLLGV